MKISNKWGSNKFGRLGIGALLGLFALTALSSTGCTTYTHGMTLPSPYYQKDTPEYHPRGAEFPFPNEAATLQGSGRELQRSP